MNARPDALVRALAELRADGYKGRDVVVLSPRASGSSARRVTEQPWCDRLRPLGDPGGGHTLYGTIHAFKGLEAPAVVITDLDEVSGPIAESPLLHRRHPTHRAAPPGDAGLRAGLHGSLAYCYTRCRGGALVPDFLAGRETVVKALREELVGPCPRRHGDRLHR